ncbi:MAG: tyrosine protein kinase, partial [Oceanicaulis sp.]
MAASEPVQLATFIVTVGAVAFALAASVWAYKLTAGARRARAAWRDKICRLEDRVRRAESVFAAHPGLVLIWDSPPDPDAKDWARPAIHGAPAALASMVEFAELGQGVAKSGDAGAEILDGLADFEAFGPGGETTTLRQRMVRLMDRGEAFSIRISGPSGRVIEAEGRPAGRQLALWLADASASGRR